MKSAKSDDMEQIIPYVKVMWLEWGSKSSSLKPDHSRLDKKVKIDTEYTWCKYIFINQNSEQSMTTAQQNTHGANGFS